MTLLHETVVAAPTASERTVTSSDLERTMFYTDDPEEYFASVRQLNAQERRPRFGFFRRRN